MSPKILSKAETEIKSTLEISNSCMQHFGINLDKPNSKIYTIKFLVSFVIVFIHLSTELAHIVAFAVNSARLEDIVPVLHTFGYGCLSIIKAVILWYNKDKINQLLNELCEIWPTENLDKEEEDIKNQSLTTLRFVHRSHFLVNTAGVWFYNSTPIAIYLYQYWHGKEDAQLGFVWSADYPFDKYRPVVHFFVYLFEIFMGQVCVWVMVSSDLLFSAMASHITLLLRLLKHRLEKLGSVRKGQDECYNEVVVSIKLHQQLQKYCKDVEKAFTLVNFINIMMSSFIICCAMFVIVFLESFVAVSNKLFLASALLQVGMLCWYADELFHANSDISIACYNNEWYHTSVKIQKCLLFMVQKSQKTVAFTAMNFTNITLATFSSILTRSYSYFALLYTMYNKA